MVSRLIQSFYHPDLENGQMSKSARLDFTLFIETLIHLLLRSLNIYCNQVLHYESNKYEINLDLFERSFSYSLNPNCYKCFFSLTLEQAELDKEYTERKDQEFLDQFNYQGTD